MKKSYSNPRHRFTAWLSRNKITIIIGAVILIGAGVAMFFYYQPISKPGNSSSLSPNIDKPEPEPEPEPIIYHSPLTGLVVSSEASVSQAVTGVMIENSTSARPQSGLKNSGIVFEAIAEGGITRFMVLYQDEKPQLIGPVRSLRPYYLSWAAGFDASIAHVGGSDEALREVRNGSYRDIDQFFNAGTYWRATDRYAPHNVYTNFERIDALNQKKGYTSSKFTAITRVDEKPLEEPKATKITVNISSANFNSTYAYDSASNSYARSQAGKPHLDREHGQISPKSVVVLHVTRTAGGYYQNLNTIGQGKVTIFQNGDVVTGTWKKPSQRGQLSFYDAEGSEIALVRGQTWFVALPTGQGSMSWQ
jgi:hypothetical protein